MAAGTCREDALPATSIASVRGLRTTAKHSFSTFPISKASVFSKIAAMFPDGRRCRSRSCAQPELVAQSPACPELHFEGVFAQRCHDGALLARWSRRRDGLPRSNQRHLQRARATHGPLPDRVRNGRLRVEPCDDLFDLSLRVHDQLARLSTLRRPGSHRSGTGRDASPPGTRRGPPAIRAATEPLLAASGSPPRRAVPVSAPGMPDRNAARRVRAGRRLARPR